MLGSFVSDGAHTPLASPLVQASHNTALVLLSLLIAFGSNCAALYMAHTNRRTSLPSHRRVLLLCASMLLGLGIWAMHFMGMQAMRLSMPVRYDTLGTLLSIIPGMVAAWLALHALQVKHPSNLRIATSGLLVGLGIAAMHYSGIAAMQLQAQLHFLLPQFLLSLLLGPVFAIAAFAAHRWLYQRGLENLHWAWRLLPPLLLTVAMASMHYVAMHAMRFDLSHQPMASQLQPTGLENHQTLSLAIAATTGMVFVILGLAHAVLRYRDLWQALAVHDARLNAMVDTAVDGVITINERGLVQDFNPAAARIFGYAKDEVIGRNISMLMPSPLAEQHDAHLLKHVGHPEKAITVTDREVLGKRKDGRHVPLHLAIGKASTPSGILFVGYLQDISARKRTDAQLRIAASVFQHVREGVAIVDANHNISDVNPAFSRLMEKSREECLGQALEALYDEADLPSDMGKLWQAVATQQYWQSEIMVTRRNGTLWMQRLSISPVLNEHQRPQHFIAVISDVSERPGPEAAHSSADLHDSATGLPTHKLFIERLSSGLLNAKRKSAHLGVMVVKTIARPSPSIQPVSPDHTGALQLMAQQLQLQLRSTDTLARWADDQLALLLTGIDDAETLHALVQRLEQSISDSHINYRQYAVDEIQLGCTSTLHAMGTASELIALAVDDLRPLHTQPKPLPH